MTSKSRLVSFVVACAFFMQGLDTSIIGTALPQIAVAFKTSPLQLSMTITAYIVSSAVFIPVSGWVADRFGSSLVFRAAIVIFTLSSIGCGLSQNLTELTLARVVQGMAGAMMVPVGRLVVLRTSEKSELVSALSVIVVPGLVGPVLGAPVGGFITTYFSWRWIFFINIPIGILGVVLATLFIPNFQDTNRQRFDWQGFLLSGVTVSCVMYGLEAFSRGTESAAVIAGFLIVGVAFGVVTWWHSRRHEAPVINLALLRVTTFRMAMIGGMSTRMATGAMPFLLPLLFQVGLGKTAFSSGMLTFASSLGAMTMRATAKPILKRFGFRNVLIRNGAFTAVFVVLCAFFNASTPALVVIVVLLAGGFFRALGNSSLSTLAYADISDTAMSSATGLSQLVNRVGNALGISAAAVLLHVSEGWHGATQLGQQDFRFAFIGIGVIAVISLPFFSYLSPDAGAELSGHRVTTASGTIAPREGSS